MRLNDDETGRRARRSVPVLVGFTLALTLTGSAAAQTQLADSKLAESKPAESKPAESKAGPETYQTIFLTNLTQQNDLNDLQTALRNMLPRAKLYAVPSQGAITVKASPEDVLLAQKMISDLDRTKKIYRLTYTISETDGGRRAGVQHFAVIVASGGKTTLRQGSRIPLVTGTINFDSSAPNSQVQYVDVGLNIDASLDAFVDGVRLRTKVEQSSIADEKSGIGAQDPIIRQTMLEGTSTLVQGKPLVLGSVDIPGTARREEIEVVSELVH